MKIVIVDYDMGNIRSIQSRLKRIGFNSVLSSKPEDIISAEKLILPGVGHFAQAMKKLQEYGLIDILNKKVIEMKTPILGICLGVQLFTSHSEEGDVKGLGWIDAKTVKFNFQSEDKKYKIPHIGWNTINIKKENSLFKGIRNDDLFYFVHSFHLVCSEKDDILTGTYYGKEFVSSIQRGNIYGTQFHPEKSQEQGMRVLDNFIERC